MNETLSRSLYRKLVALYPHSFREQMGESMEQTYLDLSNEWARSGRGLFGFVLWTFLETALGIVREHLMLFTKRGAMENQHANEKNWSMTIQKWGALASFILAATFIVPRFVYLVGNLRDALGPLSYDLADFLYGPVWAVSLVTMVYALRERFGDTAPRRMNLALATALLAAAAMVAVACIRSANRHYHIDHPELNLENSLTVLAVWTTLVAGVTSTALHFLGWSFVLSGSAGWTSRRLPRVLSVLYLIVGAAALFAYLLPQGEENVAVFGLVLCIWQGIVLLKGEPGETQVPEINASQPNQA
jgi:hypothetical protein